MIVDDTSLLREVTRAAALVIAIPCFANLLLPFAANNPTPLTWVVAAVSLVAGIGLVLRAIIGLSPRWRTEYAGLVSIAAWTLNFFELAPIAVVPVPARMRFLLVYVAIIAASTLLWFVDRSKRFSG